MILTQNISEYRSKGRFHRNAIYLAIYGALKTKGNWLCSPVLANIFVGLYERLLFDKFPKPNIYLCYVDDTFASFSSCNEALLFFHGLNGLHHSLTSTIEEEKDNKLLIFDVLVECCSSAFLTCIYRTLTFTGLWGTFGDVMVSKLD